MKRARLLIDGTGLEFDRDYGVDKRTGWSAIVDGRVCAPQLTSLTRAAWALLCELCR